MTISCTGLRISDISSQVGYNHCARTDFVAHLSEVIHNFCIQLLLSKHEITFWCFLALLRAVYKYEEHLIATDTTQKVCDACDICKAMRCLSNQCVACAM